MGDSIELAHGHFKLMKKAVATIEKEWSTGALAAVKDEIVELEQLTNQIKKVIKNQLYRNLKDKEKVFTGSNSTNHAV